MDMVVQAQVGSAVKEAKVLLGNNDMNGRPMIAL
jgi:hypothetical protein